MKDLETAYAPRMSAVIATGGCEPSWWNRTCSQDNNNRSGFTFTFAFDAQTKSFLDYKVIFSQKVETITYRKDAAGNSVLLCHPIHTIKAIPKLSGWREIVLSLLTLNMNLLISVVDWRNPDKRLGCRIILPKGVDPTYHLDTIFKACAVHWAMTNGRYAWDM